MTVPARRERSRTAELALRLEDLKDDASDASEEARRRLLWAWTVTLLAPVSYAGPAAWAWMKGRSWGDPLVAFASVAFAAVAWAWWWLAVRRVADGAVAVFTCEHIKRAARTTDSIETLDSRG